MSILGFANNILSQYGETPEDQKNGRDKDGALCMMGALSEEILEGDEEIEGMMEPFFVSHVLPEFKSRFPYLRARVSLIICRRDNFLPAIYRHVMLQEASAI